MILERSNTSKVLSSCEWFTLANIFQIFLSVNLHFLNFVLNELRKTFTPLTKIGQNYGKFQNILIIMISKSDLVLK